MWHYLRKRHWNKMKRVWIQAWDLAQENETLSLNTAGGVSPNQNWSAWTSKWREKMKWSPSLMWKHQGTANLQTLGKDFSLLLQKQAQWQQQAGARSYGEELESVTLERLFRRGAGINSAKHPKTDWIFLITDYSNCSVYLLDFSIWRWPLDGNH